MAATLQIASFVRGPMVFGNLAGVFVTINANSAVYAKASGGLPIDLTSILQQAAPSSGDAPNYTQAINPLDVVGALALQPSTNGFLPASLVVGTPTYTAVPWQSASGPASVPGVLATCPATIRLLGTGAGANAAFGEVADGANTDTFTFLLLIARNGANN